MVSWSMKTCFSQKLILLNFEFWNFLLYIWILPIFLARIMPDFLLKNRPWFYKNEPVWRISRTALLLLLTFSCFLWHSIAHIAHLRHFCILCTRPLSCFGGLNERWAATLFFVWLLCEWKLKNLQCGLQTQFSRSKHNLWIFWMHDNLKSPCRI